MTTTLSRRRVAPTLDDANADTALSLRRRVGLPGSRAVVGGLLVTLSALVAWWSATAHDQVATEPVVVAAHDVGPGHRLVANDLRIAEMAVPRQLAGATFATVADLTGAVSLGPIGAGELIQPSAVARSTARAEPELSFPIQPDWAVAASLRAGDRVDVFATYGTGPSARTVKVLAGATLRRIESRGEGGLGSEASQVVTVGLASGADAAEVVNASRAASLTLVRTTGSRGAPGNDEYVLDDDVSADGAGGEAGGDS